MDLRRSSNFDTSLFNSVIITNFYHSDTSTNTIIVCILLDLHGIGFLKMTSSSPLASLSSIMYRQSISLYLFSSFFVVNCFFLLLYSYTIEEALIGKGVSCLYTHPFPPFFFPCRSRHVQRYLSSCWLAIIKKASATLIVPVNGSCKALPYM